MAKPMLVTLPFVLLLLDYWPLGRLKSGAGGRERWTAGGREADQPRTAGHPSTSAVRLVVEKIPFVVLAAASCLVTLLAQRGAIQEQVDFSWRIGNAAVTCVAYLGKMFYPADLAVYYPFSPGRPSAWEVVAAIAALLLISAAACGARWKCPYLLFGWLWYLGTLVPVIGLVQVGAQSMADRYTYLTQIGLAMAIAWGAADLAGVWPSGRWCVATISALVLGALMACAWRQAGLWRDSETLWTHTLACTSRNPFALSSLGSALADRGEVDKAIAQYRKALEIAPDFAGAHFHLGLALAGRRELDEATAHYRRALEINPGYAEAHNNLANLLADRGQLDDAMAHYTKALEIKPDYAVAHNNLGLALAGRGRIDEAIAEFRKSLEIKPVYAEAHVNLATALAGRGEVDEAISHCRKALEIKPDYAEAHFNLGVVLAGRGEADEAMAHFRKALEFKPSHVQAHVNLAAALASRGELDEAIVHYRKALEIKPEQTAVLNNLAAALAARGEIDEAIVHYRRALEIQPDLAEAHYNLGEALAGRGKLNEALEHFHRALDLASARNDRAMVEAIRARIGELQ